MVLKFDWLRHYPSEIQALDEIPLLGLPAFPWEKLSESLAKTFECADFEIFPQEITWRTKEDLLTDFNQPFSLLTFTIPTLTGEAYWLLPTEEVVLLECLLLTNEANPLTIQDQDFKNTFYRFLALETLYAINRTIPDPFLSPVLTAQKDLPLEDSLSLNISIKINNRYFSGRLVISQQLRQSLVNYSQKNLPKFSLPHTQNITVPVQVGIGHTMLTLAEWKQVSLGDFITLDRCSIGLEDLKGQVTLSAFGQQAFKGQLQGTQIKIIEFPLFQEEDTYMTKDNRSQDEDEDDLSDLNFDDEDEDDDFDELDEDLFKDFDIAEEEEEVYENEQPRISGDQSLELSNEQHTASEDELVTDQTEKPTEQPAQGLLKPEQVPVSIIVELGRIQMTMDKLLQLEPGNLIDISLDPLNGVDLTLNGKIIAKAELIRIGENVGVRILELG